MNRISPVIPQSPEELYKLSKYLLENNMAKKKFKTAGNVFFAINLGLESGLTPSQSITTLSMIGDIFYTGYEALLAIVQNSGKLEDYKVWYSGNNNNNEMTSQESASNLKEDDNLTAHCLVKRVGMKEPHTTTFSVADAKRAKLWHPGSSRLPWNTYRTRMLKIKAINFALRDNFASELKGLTTKEEAYEIAYSNNNNTPNVKAKPIHLEFPLVTKPKATKNTSELIDESTTDLPDKVTVKTSELIGEDYINDKDGSYHMESGVTYTLDEVKKLFGGISSKEAKILHNLRISKYVNTGKPFKNLFTSTFGGRKVDIVEKEVGEKDGKEAGTQS